jgi:hypothetical protein
MVYRYLLMLREGEGRDMMTEVWFRNPRVNVSLFRDEGISRIVFSQTELGRQKHNGLNLIRQIYASSQIHPQIMILGKQGAQLYRPEDCFGEPSAVYPTWSPKTDDWEDLEFLIANPAGDNARLCADETIDRTMRSVFGQEHKVVLYNFGGMPSSMLARVGKLQLDNPGVTLHVNGLISFAYMFAYDLASVDVGLEDLGDQNRKIRLAPGRTLDMDSSNFYRDINDWRHWIELFGITVKDFLDGGSLGQQARYLLRIRSILWAQQHYNSNFRYAGRGATRAMERIAATGLPHQGQSIVIQRKQYTTAAAEKVLCDQCSIAPGCRVFRAGQICGLKESEMADLAKFFQHRDAGRIVEGLAELTRMRAERLETAMEKESESDQLDPEVTKQMGGLFADGVKLAKLVDPKLSGAANVNVNVGVGVSAGIVSSQNPKELVAAAVRALEEAGIPRNEIDGDMIKGMLKGLGAGGTLGGLAVGERMVHAATAAPTPPTRKEIEGSVVLEVPATRVF